MDAYRHTFPARNACYAAILILGVLAQTSWAHLWKVWGTYPDLFLVLSVCAGMTLGTRRATMLGLLFGYLEGIMQGDSLGSFMVSRGFVALLAAMAETRLYRENLWVSVIGVLLGTIVGEAVFLIMTPHYPFPYWAITMLKEAVYNSVFTLPFFVPLSHLTRRSIHFAVLSNPGIWQRE